MNVKVINGTSLPNILWQDRPAGCKDVIWRADNNPIIPRDLLPTSNSIFNSAVVPFESEKGKFAGVFRVDDKERNMAIHAGFSEDGVHWNLNEEKVEWINDDPETAEANPWQYGYDPRCVWIEDRFWITWCNAYGWKPTIGVGWTKDFKEFHQCENAFLPFNRNGVLFPRKINGKYVMFSRPSDSGHTPFGDMYLSQSPDMKYLKNGTMYSIIGYLKVEQGDAEAALAFNREALDYDDADPVFLDNMGQTYYRLVGDKETAKTYFDKAIALKPTAIDTNYFLSLYDIEAGDREKAVERLQTARSGFFSPLNYATPAMIDEKLAELGAK